MLVMYVCMVWHPEISLHFIFYTLVLFESFTIRMLFYVTYAVKCKDKKKS